MILPMALATSDCRLLSGWAGRTLQNAEPIHTRQYASLIFLKLMYEQNKIVCLRIGDLASVRRHLAGAIHKDSDQGLVGHVQDLGAVEGLHVHHLPRWSIAKPRRAVTH
jgi:hypothetical protein